MKTENGYHIDNNGNKWTASIYTIEQAVEFSKSLTNCFNCSDCSYCSDCRSCSSCSYCSDCSSCSSCSSCRSCSSCSYCSDCSSCSSCSYCSYCSDCSDCRSCSSCSYCSDCSSFEKNPQRIVSPILGSRKSQTTIYWANGITQVVCGCFKGTIEEFKSAIEKTHGNNQYGQDYNNWLNKAIQYILN